MFCLKCNKETKNSKFCSRSCSNSYNNQAKPKRKLTRMCTQCSELVWSHEHVRCELHHKEYNKNKHKNKTLAEYRALPSVSGKHPSWLNAHVRGLARSSLKHLKLQPCRHCGYDKHVELAHIKAVSSFPDTALICEVNDESNIIPLCPNCHWEFDNLPR